MDLQKLNNPVWYALAETHQQFSIDLNGAKFYKPDYCPFGAYQKREAILEGINNYSRLSEDFFVVGQRPDFSSTIHLKNELVCNQMIIERKISLQYNEDIVSLNENHADRLYELVNLVQPGYFKINTRKLGNYYGIFKDTQLVAVTGERMCMFGFTEVSAVVTHPLHTGNGYAKQLVAYTVNEILNGNNVPFLHVTESNIPAIQLYEKLGFSTRRKISFWHFTQPYTISK